MSEYTLDRLLMSIFRWVVQAAAVLAVVCVALLLSWAAVELATAIGAHF